MKRAASHESEQGSSKLPRSRLARPVNRLARPTSAAPRGNANTTPSASRRRAANTPISTSTSGSCAATSVSHRMQMVQKMKATLASIETVLAKKPVPQKKGTRKCPQPRCQSFLAICKDLKAALKDITEQSEYLTDELTRVDASSAEEQARSTRLEAELLTATKQVAELEKQLAAKMKDESDKHHHQIAEINAQHEIAMNALRAEHKASTEAKAEEDGHLRAEIESSRTALQAEIADLKLKNERMLASQEAEKAELDRSRQELAEARRKCDDREGQTSKMFEQLAEITRKHSDELNSKNDERREVETQLAETRKQVATLQQAQEQANSARNDEQKAKEAAEAEVAQLRDEIAQLRTAAEEARGGATELRAELKSKDELRAQVEAQLQDWQERHAALCAQRGAERSEAAAEMAQQRREAADAVAEERSKAEAAQQERNQLTTEVATLREEGASLRRDVDMLREASKGDAEQMRVLRESKREADELRHKLGDIAVLSDQLKARDSRIQELEKDVAEGDEKIRKLHNKVQELRGNVRVFARVRPFMPRDGVDIETVVPAAKTSRSSDALTISDRNGKDQVYRFDKTFPPSSGQEEVFGEVQDFVQSALDGFNVCLFAYGQTGSGKTHTMEGSAEGEMRGIIPRAMEKILRTSEKMADKGWTYSFSVSFLEIYNEELRDLLLPRDQEARKLDIRLESAKSDAQLVVPGLTEQTVSNMSQIQELLRVAKGSRSVSATKMNAQSSRSHSVFILRLVGRNAQTRQELVGTLNLCDLAGSERLKRSGAEGMQRTEAQNINKSLSTLARVFDALHKKGSSVPFRDSKLTYLMKNCLSGNGKTLMMVNVSPTEESRHESIHALDFAARANKCELGKPKRQLLDVTNRPGAAAGTAATKAEGRTLKRPRTTASTIGRA